MKTWQPLTTISAKKKKNKNKNKTKKKHVYSLEGTGHKSPELVFRNLSSPLSLSRDQELQIWHGQDLAADCWDGDNTGTVCVDVYAWYIASIMPV